MSKIIQEYTFQGTPSQFYVVIREYFLAYRDTEKIKPLRMFSNVNVGDYATVPPDLNPVIIWFDTDFVLKHKGIIEILASSSPLGKTSLRLQADESDLRNYAEQWELLLEHLREKKWIEIQGVPENMSFSDIHYKGEEFVTKKKKPTYPVSAAGESEEFNQARFFKYEKEMQEYLASLAQVFLSYARLDQEAVEQIYRQLRNTDAPDGLSHRRFG